SNVQKRRKPQNPVLALPTRDTSTSLRRTSARLFLQADGGIRDATVTGVQTCALPIYLRVARPSDDLAGYAQVSLAQISGLVHRRSEERRVGKEGGSRSPEQN